MKTSISNTAAIVLYLSLSEAHAKFSSQAGSLAIAHGPNWMQILMGIVSVIVGIYTFTDMPKDRNEDHYFFSRFLTGMLFIGGIYLFVKGISG